MTNLSRRDLLFGRKTSSRRETPEASVSAATVDVREVERPPEPSFLRPPGARTEGVLLDTCQRCGACREACPEKAIVPLSALYGRAVGTPAIFPESAPCRMCEDFPCVAACPTGALFRSPDERVVLGVAQLDRSRCWSVRNQPCDYCMTACPVPGAIRFEGAVPTVSEVLCVGCGLCVYYCTATPRALAVVSAHGG